MRIGEKQYPSRLSEDDKDDDGGNRVGRSARKKKRGSSRALVDAVIILALAKIEGEEKKFEFLNCHFIHQGELQQEELQLECEILALEKEKAKAE
ncbi:hypothetical protein L873DRAFT_867950 [Choiromyces venosus 120613-1]|uniref:Uncharacterized protein n=1 Tax=Choiromyces venosus 120613-1 TaxID=1336337 RepID=A0A3N4JUT3_9PEZI|nr:hypothetical protein L873DRAFT_867950 [Choiromyces venosus 120613-1]